MKIKTLLIILFSLGLLSASPLPIRGDSDSVYHLSVRRDLARRFKEEKLPEIKTVGLLAPIVNIVEYQGAGRIKRKEKQARKATGIIQRVLISGFKELPFKVKLITPDESTRAEIEEILLLYPAVNSALNDYFFVFDSELMKLKKNKFDYSLGPLERVAEKYRVDALLLVKASDRHFSAFKALEDISAAVLTGLLVRGLIITPNYQTALDIAVANGSGEILWHGSERAFGGKLLEAGDIKELLKEAFSKISPDKKEEPKSYKNLERYNPRGFHD